MEPIYISQKLVPCICHISGHISFLSLKKNKQPLCIVLLKSLQNSMSTHTAGTVEVHFEMRNPEGVCDDTVRYPIASRQ